MAKPGRNEPCPCGSGKKYKQCHGPIDTQRETELRRLRQAPDTLLPKIIDAAPSFAGEFEPALGRFWNGRHSVTAVEQLDELEERGAERFLVWFMFDHRGPDGRTPLERLAEEPADLDLTEPEAQVLTTWTGVRFQPYEVVDVRKGRGFTVRPLWEDRSIDVEDHAAARRVEIGELVIVHLTPAADTHVVTGAAAHLTGDTVAKLREFAELHLGGLRAVRRDADYPDLIREHSEIFNHFIMALPREEKDAGTAQNLIDNTRVMLSLAASRLGLTSDAETTEPRMLVPTATASPAEPNEDVTDGGSLHSTE